MNIAPPKLQIKKHHEIRIVKGSPWIYSNEIENFSALKNLEKGALVAVFLPKQPCAYGLAYFNPNSLIAARVISFDAAEKIEPIFFAKRILAAKNLREKFFAKPFYRLIHSEADFLPGLIIDRFDNVFVVQISTYGMEKLTAGISSALTEIFPDSAIIFRNDIEVRKLEGLDLHVKATKEIDDEIIIEENEIKFAIDVMRGQKTGWFFDQRVNREFIGNIAKDCAMLDIFCYQGGFGLNALKNGAKSVTFIDSSKEALTKIQKNIALNNFAPASAEFICGKAFDEMEKLISQNKKFDLITLDPPAFVKSKKDFFAGMRGYEKLVKIASSLIKKDGILFLASCSHHATLPNLIDAANSGFRKNNKRAKLIRSYGASFDHPIHPALKESEYLKSVCFIVDA